MNQTTGLKEYLVVAVIFHPCQEEEAVMTIDSEKCLGSLNK